MMGVRCKHFATLSRSLAASNDHTREPYSTHSSSRSSLPRQGAIRLLVVLLLLHNSCVA